MGNYLLVLIQTELILSVHIIAETNYRHLLHKYPTARVVILMRDTKSRCSFLYKALLSSEAFVTDTLTDKKYKTVLQKALDMLSRVNSEHNIPRIVISKLDLSVFASMWSRLTAHFPDFNKSNELIVNAEVGKYYVYPIEKVHRSFVVATDNPDASHDILDIKSVSSNGLISDIKLLSEQSAPTWQVQYTVEDATITCIKTETIDKEKLEHNLHRSSARKYTYEFMSSIEDAVLHIISETFEPKWY